MSSEKTSPTNDEIRSAISDVCAAMDEWEDANVQETPRMLEALQGALDALNKADEVFLAMVKRHDDERYDRMLADERERRNDPNWTPGW